MLYIVKVADFPVPSRDVITKLFLGFSDILAGDGKIGNLFFTVYRLTSHPDIPG
jgi:hypothetical protein